MFKRFRAAVAAFVYPELLNAPATERSTGDQTADNTLSGGISDEGTAVQARDVDSLTVDRSTETAIHNTGGIVNTGGDNSFTNTTINGSAIGHGATAYNNSTVHNGTGDQVNNINHGTVGFQTGNLNGTNFRIG